MGVHACGGGAGSGGSCLQGEEYRDDSLIRKVS